MNGMDDKDLERGQRRDDSPTLAPSPHDDEKASLEDGQEEATGFEPIRTGTRPASVATRNSRRSTGSRPISRSRSNNGYGVDEFEEGEEEPVDVEEEREQQVDREEEKDPFEMGWDGSVDTDPLSPRSLPRWRKWSIIIITSLGSFCVTMASSIYTASYTQMTAEFHTSRLVATIGLSTFVLGIALGPFWSPLAEFYGRRPIYLASFAAFLIWIIPSAVAKNIETMIIARFFQGLAGSAFLSVSGGTVGDLFVRAEMQAPMAVFTLAPFAGPSVGPLIGGFINTYVYWRWTHYVLLIAAGTLLAAITLFVPETYHPVVLKKKAIRKRKETGDDRWKAPIEKSKKSILHTVGYSLLRPFQLLIFEPMCAILDIYSAILLGILYLFFGAFPLVFMNNHGFSLWQTGLTFLGLFVSIMAAAGTSPIWSNTRDKLALNREKTLGKAKTEPEDQLPPLIVGAPLITIGLFWFGFTTYPSVHWIVPIIGSAVFGFGTMLAFTGIFTFLVDAYPLYAASALAGNALVRCVLAAAFPLFGVQMYENLGYQWATALLAFLTLAMLPFPYLFFKYGKRLRGHSRFATS